mmetsp:Transcript_46347/g.142989  ORF Transcript_46347/g.142989 Transcript_46347/m.142989 type:complete len:766 (-) Transcript_46347:184-2481(-)|eukprot:CAMPEP_0174863398 /NCGR_PEP_ID=MMETSP1114-20130205/56143_1 /TAXON_ID=312471 /ORGANISM="Neobodo designis, Strain CCAP 1951/1" /LENGTH=765 /DNA_ID=CAMNT_0016098463 /DNA_START=181 /DNA_END=2478 /DNA_ORIENTATION=+
MGCGASTEDHGNTRFTNPSLFNLTGLRFDDPPPCTTATTGIHPDADRIDEKRALSHVIRTNEGGLLVRAAPGEAVECMLIYPEYNAVVGKTPTTHFGLGMSDAKSHVDGEKSKRVAAKGATVDDDDDMSDSDSLFGSVSSAFEDAKGKAKGLFASSPLGQMGLGGGMLMEDADSAPSSPQEAPAVPPSAPTPSGDGAPKWVGAVCQFKEFDSLDDIAKPWHRNAGGGVPGLLRLEAAGPAAAWATLEPHQYQQRWALPDGDRVACFTDDSPSIPQRILAAYRACGGDEYVRALVDRIQAVRRAIPEDILMAAFDAAETAAAVGAQAAKQAGVKGGPKAAADAAKKAAKLKKMIVAAERARTLDVDAILEAFHTLMSDEGLGQMGSVYQLPPALDDLKAILGYVEDALLYNWIEVAVEAEVEVGTNYFEESDKRGKRHTEWRVWDTVLRKFLDEANELADEAFAELKEQLSILTRVCLLDAFDGDAAEGGVSHAARATEAAQRQIDALFPDLTDMVKMDADSIDAELMGVSSGFDAADGTLVAPDEIPALLQRWRTEDARPLAERRQEVYDREVARIARYVETHRDSMQRIAQLGEQTRLPIVVPRHFHDYEFILLFPRQSDHPGVRKPSRARLCIWPEGCLQLEQKVHMSDFTLPFGGVQDEDALIEKAADLYDDGDDTIDSADDPRRLWLEYPSSEWRGFRCTVEVPTGLVHDFNFELDGAVFLDHNSFVTGEKGKEYFRRVRFREAARRFTFNPLKELGIVAS